jgi:DNA-binding response OmpR family regulator
LLTQDGSDDSAIQSVPTVKLLIPGSGVINEILNETGDDRNQIGDNDNVVLVIEDDIRFARIIIEKAHERNLKAVVATGFADVFTLVNKFNPISVTLDVKLPDASGWRILDLFKNDINFRHIPVHLISGEENKLLGMQRWARSFNLKPLKNEALNILFNEIEHYHSQNPKILLIEDNEFESPQLQNYWETKDCWKFRLLPLT